MGVVGIGKVSHWLMKRMFLKRENHEFETIFLEIKQGTNGLWNLRIGDKEFLCQAITVAITNSMKNRHLVFSEEIEDPMMEAYHQEDVPYYHLEIMDHRQKVIISLKKVGVDSSIYTTMVNKFSLVTDNYIYNGNNVFCTISYNYLSKRKKVIMPKMKVLV